MTTPLASALGVTGRRCVSLVGSGGKTSLMYALARELSLEGRVVTTTTTRIRPPSPAQSPHLLVGPVDSLDPRLRAHLEGRGHCTAARARRADGKLQGFDPAHIDLLVDRGLTDVVLVEADGSAGRPLKAHADHEPVIPAATDLVLLVVGATAVGTTLGDAAVHRAALAAERLGLLEGAELTASRCANLVLHPHGALRDVTCETAVVITQAAAAPVAARDLATAIQRRAGAQAGHRVFLAELATGSPWVVYADPSAPPSLRV